MGKIRKIITTGLIATTLATAVVASTPASAWYRGYGGYYGGGWGWWGAPAIAAIGLGALAVGAVAAGAGAYPYYYGGMRLLRLLRLSRRLRLCLPGPGAILRHTKPGLRRLGQFCRLPADAGGLLRRRLGRVARNFGETAVRRSLAHGRPGRAKMTRSCHSPWLGGTERNSTARAKRLFRLSRIVGQPAHGYDNEPHKQVKTKCRAAAGKIRREGDEDQCRVQRSFRSIRESKMAANGASPAGNPSLA